MTKAILVLNEMPKTCWDCQLDYDCGNGCMGIGDGEDYVKQSGKKRPDKCPLKPMPEKELSFTKDGWFMGWNYCIDEILGKGGRNHD